MNRTDGFITMDAADYCPTSTQAMRSWFAENGRKCYYAGPLIPQQKEDILSDPRSHQTKSFLDEKLTSHGEKSVIYVCRGPIIASLTVVVLTKGRLDFLRINVLAHGACEALGDI